MNTEQTETRELEPEDAAPLQPQPATKQEEPQRRQLAAVEDFSNGLLSSSMAFEQGLRQAKCLASSSMVPLEYQAYQLKNGNWIENPTAVGNCVIALELAARLRVPFLAIMQGVDIIHGRPAFRGQFLIGLINGCGLFSRATFEWKGDEKKDDWGVRMIATEKATGTVLRGTWVTWKMAKDEGWTTRKGNKYGAMADQMLSYRAASFWSRLYAPDLTMGVHESEELRDIIEGDAKLVERSTATLNDRLADASDDGAKDVAQVPDPAPKKERAAPRKRRTAEELELDQSGKEAAPKNDASDGINPDGQTLAQSAASAEAVSEAVTSNTTPAAAAGDADDFVVE